SLTIAAAALAPTITSAAPPATGTVGTAYAGHTFTATGVPTTMTWTVSAGALPAGITLNSSTGVLAGTPTASGSFSFTVQAANGTAPNATQAVSLTIAAAALAPTITSAAPPATGTVGSAYAGHTFTATGVPAAMTWTVSAGALPAGITLNSSTGVLAGTPTASGSFSFTVQAANGTAPNATQNVTITIGVAGNFAVFGTGVAAVGALAAPGSVDPHYTLIASAEPSLPDPNAIIATSIPTDLWLSNGPNSQWIAPSADQSYPGPVPCNAVGSYTYRTTFNLAGFNPATAVINGQWAVDNGLTSILINGASVPFSPPGSYSGFSSFTISSGFVAGGNTLDFTISDSGCPNGFRAELTGTAVITTPTAPVITSAAPPASGTVGTAYAGHTFTATGVPINMAWTVSAGALPAGITLNSSTGVLAGTPTASGSFSFTVQAANGTAPDATQAVSLTIAAAALAPTITSAAPPATGTVGTAYAGHTFTATGVPTTMTWTVS
ncbi:MAG: putative Ig domain-containing protein, partial [bacterium]